MTLTFKRVIGVGWFCLKWGLVATALAVAATAAYLYHRADEQIRCHVQQQIAQHYVGLKVTVRSAELVEGHGIEIRGLSIIEPGANGPRAELLHCDQLFLSCATDLTELLSGSPQITQVTIRRPTLRATRRSDGGWSIATLLPLPQLCEHPPPVVVEDGIVEIVDPLSTPNSTLSLRRICGTLSPPEPTGPNPQARRFRATLSGDHLRTVEFEGMFNPVSLDWSVGGTIDRLDIAPELLDALPGTIAAHLGPLRSLRGQGNLRFRVDSATGPQAACRFDLAGSIVRGRLDDSRLPHPLTELQAKFHVTNQGLAVEELAARSGSAALRIVAARQAGFELGKSPLWLQAEVRQLELEPLLLERLPQELQAECRKYGPEGQINADVKLHFDGQRWHPDLDVECLNVSLIYYKFPYRLEHAKGSFRWKETPQGHLVEADLTAYSGSQPVKLDARILRAPSGPSGWFEAHGTDLQLDKKMLDAISEQSQPFVKSLQPSGTADVHVRIWRDLPQDPLHQEFVVELDRCSMRYEKFPYPLSNVCGTLRMLDDEWTFDGLTGANDTGRVTCQRGWLASRQRGRQLYLRLIGDCVPLEEELRDALREDIQGAWDSLRPQGTVDLVAELHYLPESNKLSLGVTASPRGDSTRIEPVHFPYRLEKLRGVLRYQDGRVTFNGLNPGERFRAEHGPTKVGAVGYCDFSGDGAWDLHLERLTVDGLRLDDRDLSRALPGRLRRAIVELRPSGPVNLHGNFALSGRADVSESVRSQWNLTTLFRGTAVSCGPRLENLRGSITLVGAANSQSFYSRGELAIDSLTCKDLQFAELAGPLWIDDRQVLLGSWVDRQQGGRPRPDDPPPQPRPLTARLFGGILYGDGWISLGDEPRYGLRATLSQADLQRFAQEVVAGRQSLRGKITATVDLHGSGRSLNGLGGQGTIQLREGDVYELPLMIALLKILSIRPPDQTAFSTSDIDFRIAGGHVYFDRIHFNGDAISLRGSGEMDFQQSIRLTFHAIVGRGTLNIPLVKELFTGASQQIMQIHAGGTLHDPEIRKEPFPVVGQALQLLQGDPARGTSPQPQFPQTQQWMPNVGNSTRSRW